jgi:predicted O-linked N-acetylglucosamine transferase (SPINDLY family)
VQHFRRHFTCAGVEAERIILLPLAVTTRDHLHLYNDMDISLDPFPYAGTTTTCEALAMGVPCVTLRGKCHAHNVGVSLMNTLGLTEWVADSPDEYVAIATRMAADLPALALLRRSLRQRLLSSRLCAGKEFVRDLEDTYRELWRRYCTTQLEAAARAKRAQ